MMNPIVTIATEYSWEMGHRLPFHSGLCKNLHGHSYKLRVELSGTPDKNGILIDFYDLGLIIEPIIKELDHSFLCDVNDAIMKTFFESNPMKVVFLPFSSTVENICRWLMEKIHEQLREFSNLQSISIRIYETSSSFAEVHTVLNKS